MQPKMNLHLSGLLLFLGTTISLELPLSEETGTHFDEANYEAFKHFGDKTILKDLERLEEKPIAVPLSLNANLEHTFEHNLIAPNLQGLHSPDAFNLLSIQTPNLHQGVRYTSTPTEAYQVNEDVYEPKPIPQLVKPATAPLILGSGSLGVVDLGHGKYALGSGSLGYSQPVIPQPGANKPFGASGTGSAAQNGGLHVVQAPQLGSSEAFDAAFNNFNFKPLSHFFGNN